MNEKKSFVLYTKHEEIINSLSDEEAGKLIKAIFKYVNKGIEPQLNGLLNVVFIPIRQDIDSNMEKWLEEKNKRAEAGRKGMQARWGRVQENNNVITENNKDNNVISAITKITDNVNVNVNVNDNVLSKEKNIKKRKTFQKPTVEEIKQYCLDRKNNIDPENFFDFYESKGWKVGKEPMKDWKASIRTWEKNNKPIQRSKNSNEREYEDMDQFYDDV